MMGVSRIWKLRTLMVVGLAAASSVALADGATFPSASEKVDLDYGGNCVTNEPGYSPSGTEASTSLDEHRARAGVDGMYCAAEVDEGYGFVASHDSGTRVHLAGEHLGVESSVDSGIAGRFENTYFGTEARFGSDAALSVYGQDSYCVAGTSDASFAVGMTCVGRHAGVRGATHEEDSPAVVGENASTMAYGALADGHYGVSAASYGGTTAYFDSTAGGEASPGRAAHLEGDLHVNGAYTGSLGATHQGAPYPRAAYDSGWVYFKPGQQRRLDPELDGNIDNCRVEVVEKSVSGRTIRPAELRYGGAPFGLKTYGSTWVLDTDSQEITVSNADKRKAKNRGAKYIRVRVWFIM